MADPVNAALTLLGWWTAEGEAACAPAVPVHLQFLVSSHTGVLGEVQVCHLFNVMSVNWIMHMHT